MHLLAILWYCVVIARARTSSQKLESLFEWRYIDYSWDSNEQKAQFLARGDYAYEKITPIDVDKAKDGRVFVTAIGDVGVPASLSTVTNFSGPSGPLLKPYPDWSWYKRGDCEGIISVYRVSIDECNRMYVLDNGFIGSNYTCQAKILIIDLGTDRVINRIIIPDNVSQNRHGVGKLVTPVIEMKGPNCELQNIFMADVNGYGLVVRNEQRLFRLEADVFLPEEAFANVSIAGESFVLRDSLMGLALTPQRSPGEGRDLLLRPFASRNLYAGDTRVLSRSTFGDAVRFKVGRSILPSQATAMGADSRGTLFLGLTKEIAIGCWNRYRAMSPENVVIAVSDEQRLQFASGLKVLPSSRTNGAEEVWVLTNRLQKNMNGNQNFEDINFRVLRAPVDRLTRGTKCEPPQIIQSTKNEAISTRYLH